jgi:hypothetical protein
MIVIINQRQYVGGGVTQSPNVGITITGMETIVAPNMDFIKRGILLGFATKLGSGLGGVSVRRNLS